MNPKTLLILLALTGLAAAGATLALRERESAVTNARETGRFFPELIDSINDVASVRVRTADGAFTLERADDGWAVAEKGGYPAEAEPVRKLLIGVAELHTVEPKTDDPERHAKLGVEDVDRDEATSKEVVLRDAAGEELAALVVGNRRATQGARRVRQLYVRRVGDDQSWLVEGEVDVQPSEGDWLQKEIYSIPQSRIQSIEVEHADGEVLRVRKESKDDAGFAVLDLEEGQELRFPTVANPMAGGVSSLKLDDVQPADAVDVEEGWLSRTTVRTFDGLVLRATLKDLDGLSYATFAASYEPPPGPPAPEPAPEATDGEDAEGSEPIAEVQALGPSPEEVQAEADELNARVAGWVYVIPQYDRTTMTKRVADLLKEPEPEEDDRPMVIPDSLPKNIQEQIQADLESKGHTTVIRSVEEDRAAQEAENAEGDEASGDDTPPDDAPDEADAPDAGTGDDGAR